MVFRLGLTALAAAILLVLAVSAVRAEVSAQDLGKSLTPLGAEKAGNAVGTIPPWEGGLMQAPADRKKGGHYSNPFPQDKILFTIDASNAEKYQANLSPGQIAMLKKYPTWKMNVYATRRTAAFPKAVYEETIANANRAKLVDSGNGVTGTTSGIPFPIPKSGHEVIWNHLLRYKGDTYAMNWSQAPMTRDGNYTLVRFEYEYDFGYGSLSHPAARGDNVLAHFLQTVTAPARLAGQILLVREPVDQVKAPRQAWTYNPGQRRVRLAPQVAYDNPGTASDGLRTNDDFFLYNGATDRYDWKLIGKQELYVPYNAYRLVGNEVKYADVLKAGHLNPDLTRYELHRVWVVEANLKPGMSHIYKKRVFYIDEDSWGVVVTDKYDDRGELWRVGESHNIVYYDIPMWYNALEVHYDLQSGRYLAMGLRNEEPVVYEVIKREPSDFTPAGLRAIGIR